MAASIRTFSRVARRTGFTSIYSCRSLSTTNTNEIGSIGFIGLGMMGYPMALNILKNYQTLLNESGNATPGSVRKVEVYVLDVAPGRADQLVKEFSSFIDKSNGNEIIAIAADSVAQLSSSCSTVITMLPNTTHVMNTMTGEGGVFKNARKGTLVRHLMIIMTV